jgi:diketogulonate reductase-like aldo/keto reductase
VFAHLYNSYEDFEPLLDEQLRRLQTDYIDVYLLHALNSEPWKKAYNLGVLDFLDAMLAKGKIRHAAFSFHDSHNTFREIIDAYDKWAMCQLQFNLIDEEAQAGIRGIRYAAEKGIPSVVMEPLRGGLLANSVPAAVQSILDQAPIQRPAVDWAFRWVCNHPEVAVVLSGVSTMEQLVEDVDLFEEMLPGAMSAEELAVTTQVQQRYRELVAVLAPGAAIACPAPGRPHRRRVRELEQRHPGGRSQGRTRALPADAHRSGRRRLTVCGLRPVRERLPAAHPHHRQAPGSSRGVGRLVAFSGGAPRLYGAPPGGPHLAATRPVPGRQRSTPSWVNRARPAPSANHQIKLTLILETIPSRPMKARLSD